jgi:LCP family protein required for cell wall assembly
MPGAPSRVVESFPVTWNPPEADPAQVASYSESERTQPTSRPRRPAPRHSAWPWIGGGALLGILVFFLIQAPGRTNILLIGIDRAPAGTAAARTDTLILVTVLPDIPYVGMLSIPRDLWVEVDGVGPNRINTAHFFGESRLAGSGPQAALATLRTNFGIDVDRYIRLRFDSLVSLVDALGGVDVSLENPTAALAAGTHHLNGTQALAFVRDRAGSDDFYRMLQGQMMIRALMAEMMAPSHWITDLKALPAIASGFQTNLTPTEAARALFTIIRVGPGGIDGRTIDRSMVTGVTTAGGAQVLEPDWAAINPLLLEMFGQ